MHLKLPGKGKALTDISEPERGVNPKRHLNGFRHHALGTMCSLTHTDWNRWLRTGSEPNKIDPSGLTTIKPRNCLWGTQAYVDTLSAFMA
jgi:hypothetical protein